LRALRGATWGGSEPPYSRFQISDCKLGNTEQLIAYCKMHEMMNRRSQCGTAVEPSNLGPT
jgi:hypothetical protein